MTTRQKVRAINTHRKFAQETLWFFSANLESSIRITRARQHKDKLQVLTLGSGEWMTTTTNDTIHAYLGGTSIDQWKGGLQ